MITPTGPPVISADPASLTDADVVLASIEQPSRFDELYERHGDWLYRYAYRRVGWPLAEDIVAETFLAAFARRKRYDLSLANARPWLFGIASRELATHHRKEAARYRAWSRVPVRPAQDSPDLAEQVVIDVTASAHSRALAAALADLSQKDRDVLLLIAWAELSYAEVAEALGIPLGTVRSRLNRARNKTKQTLSHDLIVDFKELLS